MRIFILFHDCVQGSFFRSKGANTLFGYLLGLLVFTPFEDWRFSHLRHHVTYANLDAPGFGDVWTMTLKEYQDSPKRTRLLYRLYRNPLVLFGLGALFIFPLSNRLPTRRTKRKEYMGVLYTNLLLVAVFVVAAQVIGWRTYLLIQVTVLLFAGTARIWCFTCSISLRAVIGPGKATGCRYARRWREARFIVCRPCFAGFPAISVTTISTTWAR